MGATAGGARGAGGAAGGAVGRIFFLLFKVVGSRLDVVNTTKMSLFFAALLKC